MLGDRVFARDGRKVGGRLFSNYVLGFALLAGFLVLSMVLPWFAPRAGAAATELFFSEYIEGTSNNKALEIFNATGSAVDLAAGGYNVQMFFNGSATAGLTINLTGTVANGDVFVLAQASANATILAQADQTNGSGWFNGDDAVVLRKGTTVIDVVGQVGSDPGSEWGTGVASTADNTLRRKPAICAGDTDGSDAFDPATEWDGFATDTFDGLGAHTANCDGGPTPTPTSTPTATPTPTPTPTPGPTPDLPNLVINELDSDTPGSDVAEFVEIYDGGAGNTSLNGLVLVFFNGGNDLSYLTIDLTGRSTNSAGYFTVGNSAVPNVDLIFANGVLQNGADAVALYAGSAASFPNNSPVTTAGLMDAIVYDTADPDDAGLLPLLNAGQPQVDENGGGDGANQSNQRCPNGEGGQRNTAGYLQRTPTPGEVNNCPAPPVLKTIAEIQGNGTASPFAGVSVITNGIVTALKTNGFFLQTPDAEVDADPMTSEGIFVFTSVEPPVFVGDAVTVTGTATEFFDMTEINVSVSDIIVGARGQGVPSPILLTTSILDAAGTIGQLERFEGMRLHADAMRSVGPTNAFGETFAVLDAVARPFREPGIEASLPIPPDPTSGVPDCCVPVWDQNPEKIMIDSDGLAGSTRLSVTSNVVFSNVTGPLDFTFGDYKILPETTPGTTANMSALPVRTALPGEFTVAGFNIENFNNNAVQRQKAALAIRSVMKSPDIIGVIEIFDLASLEALAAQINADAVTAGDPSPGYEAHLIPAPAGGTQNVGFLVKTSRIQIDSVVQERAGDTFINPNTGLPENLHDRPPLVLTATVNPAGPNPRQIIVVVNHLRSFIDIELVAGDGVRVRAKRKAQAESTAGLLQELQAANPTIPVVSIGDYNAFEFNDGFTDPIATIKGTPRPDDEVVVDESPDLVNPDFINLTDGLQPGDRYSFVFEGTPQTLDHVIVNELAFSMVQDYQIARNNADFPESAEFADDAARPERSSDHDMPVAYFKFPIRATTTTVPDISVTYAAAGQNVSLTADVNADINTVNEGTVTFTVTTQDGATTIGTTPPAAVSSGSASANFFLPGSVLPQSLKVTAEFSGGDTTLASSGMGSLDISFAICALFDETRAVRSGAAYPIKLNLCDAGGTNVSDPGIRVTATRIQLVSDSVTDIEVVDSGNANPDNNFRFDADLGGYIFNLKTTGLESGIYRLFFMAGDDPVEHSVEFRVK